MIADAHDTNLLAAYLDNRVTGEERARVVAHLVECQQCRNTLAAFARASAGDSRQVRSTSLLARGRSWTPRVWIPIAAGIAAAAIAGTVVRRSTPTEETRPPAADTPAARPAAPPSTALSPPSESSGANAPTAPAVSPPARRAQEGADAALLARRGAERKVAGKTFRLEAGEWVDTSYDPLTAGSLVEAATTDERTTLLARLPALTVYASLGDRVVVVFEGSVYRFGGPPTR